MNTGVLLINLEGTVLTDKERRILENPAVAGVLFFARNYQSPEQLTKFTADIRSVRDDLLICVDHEGGVVQRFKEHFTVLPPAARYGELYQQNPEEALALVREAGWLMASELLACGVDLSLAPVVDLDLGKTDIVSSRAFGSRPGQVISLAEAWIDGVHEAGMSAVLKHFPGHGSVDGDSHNVLPVDSRSLSEIEQQDLVPFSHLIRQGVEAVMPAHIVYSEVDDQPAGFSRIWQEDILRGQLGFGGLIMSDCLTMEGAASAGGYVDRVEQALEAGCDLLILSNRKGVLEILEHTQNAAVRGVGPGRLLSISRPDRELLISSLRYKDAVRLLADFVS